MSGLLRFFTTLCAVYASFMKDIQGAFAVGSFLVASWPVMLTAIFFSVEESVVVTVPHFSAFLFRI